MMDELDLRGDDRLAFLAPAHRGLMRRGEDGMNAKTPMN